MVNEKLKKISSKEVLRYQLGEEPEILNIVALGFKDVYGCFWDTGYGVPDTMESLTLKQIKEKYNINL